MGGPCYAHVRGGEGIEGVAGALHVIPPWCLFLLILPDVPDLARSQKQSSLLWRVVQGMGALLCSPTAYTSLSCRSRISGMSTVGRSGTSFQ